MEEKSPFEKIDIVKRFYNIGIGYENLNNDNKSLEYFENSFKIIHNIFIEYCSYFKEYLDTFDDNSLKYRHYSSSREYRNSFLNYRYREERDKNNILFEYNGDWAQSFIMIFTFYKRLTKHEIILEIEENRSTRHNYITYVNKKLNLFEYDETLSFNIHLIFSICLNFFKKILKFSVKTSNSLVNFEKCFNIIEKDYFIVHPCLSSLLDEIARTYLNRGEYYKSLEFFERSFKIMLNILPKDHLSFAARYDEIGMVYMAKGAYFRALDSFERSLNIKKIHLPVNHEDISISLNNIKNVNKILSKNKKIKLYTKSTKIVYPDDHPSIDLISNDKSQSPFRFLHKFLERFKNN